MKSVRFLALLLALVSPLRAGVRSAAAPAGEPLSAAFTLTVDGQNVPVHIAKIASADPILRFKSVDDVPNSGKYFDLTSFATFDMDGPVDVSVTCPDVVTNAKILPSSAAITPAIDGHRASFHLEHPRFLVLEVNGNWVHSLQIFANDLEAATPSADSPNTIVLGPGLHEIDQLRPPSGSTVYIADGAVVRAKASTRRDPVVALEGHDITLRGRGIIDGSLCPIHTRNLLYLCGTNLTVDGVILRDSSTWTVPIRRSQNVRIINLKLFGDRANSDGIDICNSRDVTVSNCYLRTLDDLVVVKTDKEQGPSENIDVRHCLLWNEIAHALSIGAELREPVSNVHFSDCDVIHDKGREWTLRVYHCDSALISDIIFDNIRIEETRKLISLWIGKANWSRDAERGHIRDIVFRDIHAIGGHPRIELQGFDANHAVENVLFQNVTIDGQPITPANVKQNDFVRGVVVK